MEQISSTGSNSNISNTLGITKKKVLYGLLVVLSVAYTIFGYCATHHLLARTKTATREEALALVMFYLAFALILLVIRTINGEKKEIETDGIKTEQ